MARTVRPPVIEELRIRGLGVIDDAVLELDPGLTVVTGETGAGKTMVVTGLGLLLGGRADAARSAPGPAARWSRAGSGSTRRRRRRRDRRRGGRRARRRRAPAGPRRLGRGSLAGLGRRPRRCRSAPSSSSAAELVAVHGQSDQLALLAPARQRAALDRYAGEAVGDPVARVPRDVHAAGGGRGRARDHPHRASPAAAGGGPAARSASTEVAAVAPAAGRGRRPGRGGQPAGARGRPAHAPRRRPTPRCSATRSRTTRRRARPGRRRASCPGARARPRPASWARWPTGWPRWPPWSREAAADLASYLAGVDADPARLAAVHERRAALQGLTRKYGPALADVLVWAEGGRRAAGAARRRRRARRASWPRERRQLRARLADLGRHGVRGAAGPRPSRSRRRCPTSWPTWRCRTPGSTAALEQVDDPDGLDGGPAGAPGGGCGSARTASTTSSSAARRRTRALPPVRWPGAPPAVSSPG